MFHHCPEPAALPGQPDQGGARDVYAVDVRVSERIKSRACCLELIVQRLCGLILCAERFSGSLRLCSIGVQRSLADGSVRLDPRVLCVSRVLGPLGLSILTRSFSCLRLILGYDTLRVSLSLDLLRLHSHLFSACSVLLRDDLRSITLLLKLGARGTTTLALHIRNMCSHERPQWQSHRVGSLPHTSMSDTWAVMRSVVRYLSALGSNE